MTELLQDAVERGASDLHLTVGLPPIMRISGSLVQTQHCVLAAEDTNHLLFEISDKQQQSHFHDLGEIDFSYTLPDICRFRVNAFHQRGTIAMAIRIIPLAIPKLEMLEIPAVVKKFAYMSSGLVLITGPTGSGKTTTLAALIDEINRNRSIHIITIEDPIEYWHDHKSSIVNQREMNRDTRSFACALRSALREDPDVILIGEMRDLETVSTVLTAAETGHLVFATLHTPNAVQTIDRIVDVFPPFQQQQIRLQLSLTLQAIMSQQLLPRQHHDGRIPAVEVLIATTAIRNLIREGKTPQLVSMLQTGAKWGMQTMDMSLQKLYQRGIITQEQALACAADRETFRRCISGC